MIFAISDLHISTRGDKPMDIFGSSWEGYLDKIKKDWKEKVSNDDIVLLCGDLSWALKLEDAVQDLKFLDKLPGKKIIIKGNHEHWWNSYSKVKLALPENVFPLQNNSISFGKYVFCGTRGWELPTSTTSDEDKKIYARELLRLEMSLQDAILKKKDDQEIILLTHFPPYGENYSSSKFTDIVEKFGVKKVVYGHIHCLQSPHKNFFVLGGVEYHLTSCDMRNNTLSLIAD